MPRVPSSRVSIQRIGRPGAFSANVPDVLFGGGRERQEFVQARRRTLNTFSAILEQEQKRADNYAVLNAENQALAARRRYLFDKKEGAFELFKGKDAGKIPEYLNDKMSRAFDQIHGGLQNRNQRDQFAAIRLRIQAQNETAVIGRIDRELTRWQTEQRESYKINMIEEAAIDGGSGDLNAQSSLLEKINAGKAANRQQQKDMGLSDEWLKQADRVFTSSMYRSFLTAQAKDGQIAKAATTFQSVDEQLTDQDRQYLANVLQIGTRDVKARQDVLDLTTKPGTFGGPEGPGRVLDITNPKDYSEMLRILDQKYKNDEEQRKSSRSALRNKRIETEGIKKDIADQTMADVIEGLLQKRSTGMTAAQAMDTLSADVKADLGENLTKVRNAIQDPGDEDAKTAVAEFYNIPDFALKQMTANDIRALYFRRVKEPRFNEMIKFWRARRDGRKGVDDFDFNFHIGKFLFDNELGATHNPRDLTKFIFDEDGANRYYAIKDRYDDIIKADMASNKGAPLTQIEHENAVKRAAITVTMDGEKALFVRLDEQKLSEGLAEEVTEDFALAVFDEAKGHFKDIFGNMTFESFVDSEDIVINQLYFEAQAEILRAQGRGIGDPQAVKDLVNIRMTNKMLDMYRTRAGLIIQQKQAAEAEKKDRAIIQEQIFKLQEGER